MKNELPRRRVCTSLKPERHKCPPSERLDLWDIMVTSSDRRPETLPRFFVLAHRREWFEVWCDQMQMYPGGRQVVYVCTDQADSADRLRGLYLTRKDRVVILDGARSGRYYEQVSDTLRSRVYEPDHAAW